MAESQDTIDKTSVRTQAVKIKEAQTEAPAVKDKEVAYTTVPNANSETYDCVQCK